MYLDIKCCCVSPGTVAPVCRRGQWQCSDNTQCISNKKVCDGKQDCTDGSDEGPGCALRGCRYLNGGCSQICIDIPSGMEAHSSQGGIKGGVAVVHSPPL